MLLKKPLTKYNRYQAFAVHMAISLVIFFILLVCITQYWYPGILFDTGNGWKAVGMIVGIDLILGPLLTFIVFNHNKSSLKLDLAVIALVQTAALIYGTWTIHQTRPIAIAFINNSFMTLFANSEMADDIIQLTTKLETIELYYHLGEGAQEDTINSKNFKAYQDFSSTVADKQGPYRIKNLIQLDPLLSSGHYIQIKESDGSIIKFVQK
jgi:hypothetical protein